MNTTTPSGYTQQIGTQTYHCDPQGLVQVVAPTWCARKGPFSEDHDEVVRFVAVDYKDARRIALEMWPGSVVAVWRDGE